MLFLLILALITTFPLNAMKRSAPNQTSSKQTSAHKKKKASPAALSQKWVQCTVKACRKWHKVPDDADLQELAQNPNWTCFDNDWDSDEAFCEQLFLDSSAEHSFREDAANFWDLLQNQTNSQASSFDHDSDLFDFKY